MADFIMIAVLAVVIGAALTYIMKAKKTGVKCIGCPNGASCAYRKQATVRSANCLIEGNASGCGGSCNCDSSVPCGCNCGRHSDTK